MSLYDATAAAWPRRRSRRRQRQLQRLATAGLARPAPGTAVPAIHSPISPGHVEVRALSWPRRHQRTEMEAMSWPLVIICAYLVREVAKRWQAVELSAREVRGSSIPQLDHAEPAAAQMTCRRRRMQQQRRKLRCEIWALQEHAIKIPGAQICRCTRSRAAEHVPRSTHDGPRLQPEPPMIKQKRPFILQKKTQKFFFARYARGQTRPRSTHDHERSDTTSATRPMSRSLAVEEAF